MSLKIKKASAKEVEVKKVLVKPKSSAKKISVKNRKSEKLPVSINQGCIVVHRCVNCEHIPFSINKLVALFAGLIVLLSISVLLQIVHVDWNYVLSFVTQTAQAASQRLIR